MQTLIFNLNREYIELNNLLKLAGLADSGGRGKAMVAEGLVKVDGKTESRKTAKIRVGQTVECGEYRITVVAQPDNEI
jgi:ribosome-associated protein